MSEEESCHMCLGSTDFACESCHQPVCEDCCVPMTIHNQIDYALCNECSDFRESCAAEEREEEWAWEEEKRVRREAKALTRRENYRKPENVAKRRAKRAALLMERREAAEQRMKKTVEIVSSMFKGMF